MQAPELRVGWEWGRHLACLPASASAGSLAGALYTDSLVIILTIFSRFCVMGGSLWSGWLCGTAWLPFASLSFWPSSPSSETFQWSTHMPSVAPTLCCTLPGLGTWSWAWGQSGVKSFWPSSTHRWGSAKLPKVGWSLGPLHPVHLTGLWDKSP